MRRDKRRIEISTSGIDEALQGLTSDSIGFALPQATGLRIPPVLPSYTTPLLQPRYRFCLATRTITSGATRLRGVRQGVTLGVDSNFGAGPVERPVEMTVVTPTFHFPDGNIAWYLVTESSGHRVVQMPSTNSPGWSYIETEGSAMLYSSFTNTAVDPVTGAPLYYFQNMTAYTAPKTPGDWRPLANLGNFHDLRFPWNTSTAWDSIDEIIEGTTRISLYADILQTNPATRAAVTPPATWRLPAATPEEAFILDWTSGSVGPIYWRIYGALIFEDDISPPDRDARELTKAEFT